jgi:zinc/manganese transport system substrate-binding protein/zinc transport system substrate-binding protein/manganese/iron transport system substrate-binding protein
MIPSPPMPPVTFLMLLAILLSARGGASDTARAAPSVEPLSVVVTIPVLKDLAEQAGGRHVRVISLLKGYENEHTYSPKPSDLVAVRNAQVLFQVGLGLEVL